MISRDPPQRLPFCDSCAQGANMQMCLTWITVEVLLPTHLKRMCNWAAGLHVGWCLSNVNAETETGSESKLIFPLRWILLPQRASPNSAFNRCKIHVSWFQKGIPVLTYWLISHGYFCNGHQWVLERVCWVCGFALLYIPHSHVLEVWFS